jgi:hypothetical protein
VLAADPNLANGTLFNRLEKGRFEWAQPRNKVTLGATYRVAKWTLTGRVTNFGRIKTFDAVNPMLDENFAPKVVNRFIDFLSSNLLDEYYNGCQQYCRCISR